MKATAKVLAMAMLMCLLAVPAMYGQAETVTTTTTLPITGDLVTCSGNDVTVTGQANVVFHVTANSNSFHFVEVIAGNLSGTDESGNTYSGVVNLSQSLNVSAGGEVTVPLTIVLSGAAGQFRVHAIQHITIDANGDVTSYVDNLQSNCS
jgi:hypothetical protein